MDSCVRVCTITLQSKPLRHELKYSWSSSCDHSRKQTGKELISVVPHMKPFPRVQAICNIWQRQMRKQGLYAHLCTQTNMTIRMKLNLVVQSRRLNRDWEELGVLRITFKGTVPKFVRHFRTLSLCLERSAKRCLRIPNQVLTQRFSGGLFQMHSLQGHGNWVEFCLF